MERIVIPQRATRSPVALTDVMVGAPLVSRLLLATSAPGQILMAGALGYYVGSAARDWYARRGVRPLDFERVFGADVHRLEPLDRTQRRAACRALAERMSASYTSARLSRQRAAEAIDGLLTRFIAHFTGQEIITSTQIRTATLARFLLPFAAGSCDPISGEVAIYHDLGILEPHVIAHEFAHRKGYLKELHAQVLAYCALRGSGHPVFVQAARAERLHRNLQVLAGDDPRLFELELAALPLRPELREWFSGLGPRPLTRAGRLLRAAYDRRMRLTGQNGLSDYSEGFTNFLHTFRNSASALAPRALTDW